MIEYLTQNTNHDVYFLSSGWKYDPLHKETYIRKTKNIFGDDCKTYEVINSTIIAPAFSIYMNPQKFIEDNSRLINEVKYTVKYDINMAMQV